MQGKERGRGRCVCITDTLFPLLQIEGRGAVCVCTHDGDLGQETRSRQVEQACD